MMMMFLIFESCLVDRHQSFGETYHRLKFSLSPLQPWRWRRNVSPKHWALLASQHDARIQKKKEQSPYRSFLLISWSYLNLKVWGWSSLRYYLQGADVLVRIWHSLSQSRKPSTPFTEPGFHHRVQKDSSSVLRRKPEDYRRHSHEETSWIRGRGELRTHDNI